MRRVLLLAFVACGDDRVVVEPVEPLSGTRIKLERWLYEDGTTHVDASGFFDVRLSTRCTPRAWGDDVVRCVPVAGEALYTDADCTSVVGVAALVSPDPTHVPDANVSHFIGYDWVDNRPRPSRLYPAGDAATAITAYYSWRDGTCAGPFGAPSGAAYYAVGAAIPPTTMPALEEVELGSGRLALRVLTSTDGLRVPVGIRDRELEVACRSAARDDGAVCEPIGAREPDGWFSDASCQLPLVLVDVSEVPPAVVRTRDEAGCQSYAALGSEIATPTYFGNTSGCTRVDPGSGWRTFTLGEPVTLPLLDRAVVDTGARRLAPALLTDTSDPSLQFAGEQLVDRALRAECRRELDGDVATCVPATYTTAFTLYEPGCVIPIAVTEVAAPTCSPVVFARSFALDAGVTWHAIGEPIRTTLHVNDGSCSPYTPRAGTALHGVGPALPDDAFLRGLKYGER